jgi:hypothetical protein
MPMSTQKAADTERIKESALRHLAISLVREKI